MWEKIYFMKQFLVAIYFLVSASRVWSTEQKITYHKRYSTSTGELLSLDGNISGPNWSGEFSVGVIMEGKTFLEYHTVNDSGEYPGYDESDKSFRLSQCLPMMAIGENYWDRFLDAPPAL